MELSNLESRRNALLTTMGETNKRLEAAEVECNAINARRAQLRKLIEDTRAQVAKLTGKVEASEVKKQECTSIFNMFNK